MTDSLKFTLKTTLRVRVDNRLEICSGSVILCDAATAGDLVARDLAVLTDPSDAPRLLAAVDELDRRQAA
ncbi:hypothetical protein [Azohydromonas sp.]|uniref:hypothetical protein n=1 Tax=Azohydromonas sp. TaxID=1872666 RepID=UPI002CDDE080|nr:hypothetical protein [Azohydromonas sp.]HMM85346.1 hypothetical protein [Azohydromonas sp.]